VVRLLKIPRSSAATTCLLVFIRVHSWFPFLCASLCLFPFGFAQGRLRQESRRSDVGFGFEDCRALLAMTDGGGAKATTLRIRVHLRSSAATTCLLVFIRVHSWFPFLCVNLCLFPFGKPRAAKKFLFFSRFLVDGCFLLP